jgi:hypothetical protein
VGRREGGESFINLPSHMLSFAACLSLRHPCL